MLKRRSRIIAMCIAVTLIFTLFIACAQKEEAVEEVTSDGSVY